MLANDEQTEIQKGIIWNKKEPGMRSEIGIIVHFLYYRHLNFLRTVSLPEGRLLLHN